MRVQVLGSAAGGGFPQWNCGCEQCRLARRSSPDVRPRTQSSICASADGRRWLLINASPDVRTQVLSFPPLAPAEGALRGSGIASILVTNADIDHAAGLLVLREGGVAPIYGTASVRRSLTEGLSIVPALSAFGPVDWRTIEPDVPFAICDRAGEPIGLRAEVFAVASKPPPYMNGRPGVGGDDLAGDTVGLLLSPSDGAGGTLAYVPGVRDLDDALARRLARADAILIDGTFFTDDEMVASGASKKTARMMGHAPLSGDAGTLAFLARFPAARRVLIHINNTNPILLEHGDARREVERAGIHVAHDGMEIVL